MERLTNPKQRDKTPAALLDLPNSAVIPVPLHPRRRRWRGFNQTELIAAELCRRLNLELSGSILFCAKNKKPQAKLAEAERKINVKDSFLYRGDDLRGRNVILVDDVVTTGSTLNECAGVLKSNGAGEVWGLVVAKG